MVAYTAVINRHGAMVITPEAYPSGTHLEMQNQRTKESTMCRVIWSGGEQRPGLYKMGLEMLEDHPGFWGEDYSEEVVAQASLPASLPPS